MKRHLAALFCSVLVWTGWTGTLAHAQAPGRNAAQAHIAKAKALAYEPGQDLIDVYEGLCGPALSERGPVIPPPQIAASLFKPGYTLASVIANEFTEATTDIYLEALFEIGLVLFGVTILVNLIAQLLLKTMTTTSATRAVQ